MLNLEGKPTQIADMAASDILPDVVTLAAIGDAATQLADALEAGNILFIASDEQRAEAIADALRAAAPFAVILHCPSSDALPGDTSPASAENIGRRVSALHRARLSARAPSGEAIVLISTGEAAGRLYPPPQAFDVSPPVLAVNDKIDAETLCDTLRNIGYIDDERVDEPGEIAIRERVIDVFPADAGLPGRIEIEDGTIVAIRAFDPSTQRGSQSLESLEVGRVSEPPLDESAVTLFDHLPDARVFFDPTAEERRDRFVALSADAARRRCGNIVEKAADRDRWNSALAGRDTIVITDAGLPPQRFVEARNPIRSAAKAIKRALSGGSSVLLAGSNRDLRFLRLRLSQAVGETSVPVASWRKARDSEPASLITLEMPVDRGWSRPGLTVIAAADILGSRAQKSVTAPTSSTLLDTQFGEVRLGDIVVHEDFGIGKVTDLVALPQQDSGGISEAIVIEYANGGKRLVPSHDADRIWRYGADADAVSLDRLDGSTWEKRRDTIVAAIAESAKGLAKLAADRAQRTAPKINPNPSDYERFAAGFGFTETPDQARAIDALRDDLASGKPMDRLVVGDVGYGKTEVAMRATALAALAGRQAAIAAPTTVLVRQHLETFGRRFAHFGIRVASLSRLSTAAEKKAVKLGLKDGTISVVIGTGAIAGKDVAYKDLAIVVVDEEQRFGAADKEKLRRLGDGHIVTLSATPIPRTLQMALIGLQQVSVIATPPARRQPIRTSVGQFDPVIVRTALLREKSRGGQSFFVVSRIEDMAPMARKLSELVPELTVRQAHGRLPAADIDEAMVAFADGDGDILLATNIIEAGLDVPRANTMIVWRADRFGLSQLHQLRGRVGRGGRRGQVMLLTESDAKIAEGTLKRLRTLEAFDRLGAGFAISARDLDMRGAGDLLGEAQAGHIKLIGVDLYQKLLGRALSALRGQELDDWKPDLRMGISGCLPDSWIAEIDVRIGLYCRLGRLRNIGEVDTLEDELEDRFGSPPAEAQTLLELRRLQMSAKDLQISRIEAGPEAIALTPYKPGAIGNGSAVLEEKGGRWLLIEHLTDPRERLARAGSLLDALSESP